MWNCSATPALALRHARFGCCNARCLRLHTWEDQQVVAARPECKHPGCLSPATHTPAHLPLPLVQGRCPDGAAATSLVALVTDTCTSCAPDRVGAGRRARARGMRSVGRRPHACALQVKVTLASPGGTAPRGVMDVSEPLSTQLHPVCPDSPSLPGHPALPVLPAEALQPRGRRGEAAVPTSLWATVWCRPAAPAVAAPAPAWCPPSPAPLFLNS